MWNPYYIKRNNLRKWKVYLASHSAADRPVTYIDANCSQFTLGKNNRMFSGGISRSVIDPIMLSKSFGSSKDLSEPLPNEMGSGICLRNNIIQKKQINTWIIQHCSQKESEKYIYFKIQASNKWSMRFRLITYHHKRST